MVWILYTPPGISAKCPLRSSEIKAFQQCLWQSGFARFPRYDHISLLLRVMKANI